MIKQNCKSCSTSLNSFEKQDTYCMIPHLKYTIEQVLVYSDLCNHYRHLTSGLFHHPKKKLHMHYQQSLPISLLFQPLVTANQLSLWIGLLWAFHINGIAQPMGVLYRLLSLSILTNLTFKVCPYGRQCQCFFVFYCFTLFIAVFHCMDIPHLIHQLMNGFFCGGRVVTAFQLLSE